jgi:hypothetical protein
VGGAIGSVLTVLFWQFFAGRENELALAQVSEAVVAGD